MREAIRETEIAAAVVACFKVQGWDVYQEVRPDCGGPVADIVGTRETEHGATLVHVVECKRSMSLRLLDQAMYWVRSAHYVSCAVPSPRYRSTVGRIGPAAMSVINRFGIGVLRVNELDDVDTAPGAQLHRLKHTPRWMSFLAEEHKTTCPAGSAGGGYWTPYKRTCRNLLDYVRAHPGTLLKPAIDNISTHYRSTQCARSSLRAWLAQGKVPGVDSRMEGRRITLWPTEEETPNEAPD